MVNLKPVELRLSDGTNSLTVRFVDGEPCLNIAHLARMTNVPLEEFRKELGAVGNSAPQLNYVSISRLLELIGQATAQPAGGQKA